MFRLLLSFVLCVVLSLSLVDCASIVSLYFSNPICSGSPQSNTTIAVFNPCQSTNPGSMQQFLSTDGTQLVTASFSDAACQKLYSLSSTPIVTACVTGSTGTYSTLEIVSGTTSSPPSLSGPFLTSLSFSNASGSAVTPVSCTASPQQFAPTPDIGLRASGSAQVLLGACFPLVVPFSVFNGSIVSMFTGNAKSSCSSDGAYFYETIYATMDVNCQNTPIGTQFGRTNVCSEIATSSSSLVQCSSGVSSAPSIGNSGFQLFDNSNCNKNSATLSYAFGVGACFPRHGYFYSLSCSGSVGTLTSYTDSACTQNAVVISGGGTAPTCALFSKPVFQQATAYVQAQCGTLNTGAAVSIVAEKRAMAIVAVAIGAIAIATSFSHLT